MKETVGKRIQRLRKEKGISVENLSKKINKSRATIYRYESNEIEEMPYTVLVPIAKALNTTPAYLMGWENEKDNNDINVGERLKQLRESNNITKYELAKEFNITLDKLNNYENGIETIPLETLKKIALYFNVDVNELTQVSLATSEKTTLVTTDVNLARMQETWFREVGIVSFNNDELKELINYAKFIISKRKDNKK